MREGVWGGGLGAKGREEGGRERAKGAGGASTSSTSAEKRGESKRREKKGERMPGHFRSSPPGVMSRRNVGSLPEMAQRTLKALKSSKS